MKMYEISNGQIKPTVGVDTVNEVALIYPSGAVMPSGIVVALDYKKVLYTPLSKSISCP